MRTQQTLAILLLVASASFPTARGLAQQEIPINVQGPRVVVPIRVNGSPPLDVVLDTGMGMRGVYLFRREHSEWVNSTSNVLVQIPGAGDGEASTARVVDAQTLTLGPVVLDSQPVFVGQSDRTQDWAFDGVIGRSLLVDFTVELDYDRSVMRLHPRDWHPTGPDWTRVPARVQRGLHWFEAEVETQEGVTRTIQVYIDLAAASTVELMVGADQSFSPPPDAEETLLGVGLSGEIHGWRGRTPRFRVAGYDLQEVPTEWAPAETRSKGGDADGILGNGFMRNFNVVFQYAEEALYLSPSRTFREAYPDQARAPTTGGPAQAGEAGLRKGAEEVPYAVTGGEQRAERGAGPRWQDIADEPVPVRYTVSPELKNWEESLRLAVEEHPSELRDAGIGGTVHLWVLVDREGLVRKAVVRQGSGQEALDQTALRLATRFRFFPALDRTAPVPAWFSVPVQFPSRGGGAPGRASKRFGSG